MFHSTVPGLLPVRGAGGAATNQASELVPAAAHDARSCIVRPA
jgi:hypothetical protein